MDSRHPHLLVPQPLEQHSTYVQLSLAEQNLGSGFRA